jgi:hypothetical protein
VCCVSSKKELKKNNPKPVYLKNAIAAPAAGLFPTWRDNMAHEWIFCCSSEPNMPIDFYYIPGSAPCRAVLLAAKAVGVDLNLKLTDLMAGEHLKPEFVKVCILFYHIVRRRSIYCDSQSEVSCFLSLFSILRLECGIWCNRPGYSFPRRVC